MVSHAKRDRRLGVVGTPRCGVSGAMSCTQLRRGFRSARCPRAGTLRRDVPISVTLTPVFIFFFVLLFLTQPARAAEQANLRVAIGPFFAPALNDRLQQTSKLLPELLMADLSHQARFQLVERDKVQSLWNEMNLTASSLVARDKVARLGHILSCDWLVTGTVVEGREHPVIWTKVVEVRNGFMLDLHPTPYDGVDVTHTISDIVKFLGQAGTQKRARQFVGMASFVDMNPLLSPGREDWSKRLSATMEKHFHEAGFGITEMSAVTPLFEERRLEAAGLTGHAEQRVKLQAAFWLVDGGWAWATNAAGQLSIALRLQRVGGPEQLFHFTTPAGEATEKAVTETVAKALADTNEPPPELAAKAEAELLSKRGQELATRTSPFRILSGGRARLSGLDTIQQLAEQQKRGEEGRTATLAAYQRLLLLNPKDLNAKVMLGYGLLGDRDPDQRERGQALLREVVAANDPKYSPQAERQLNNASRIAAEAEKGRRSEVPSTDRDGLEKAVATDPTHWQAKYELGALLMMSMKGADRGRAADLLGEVMNQAPPELAEQARQRMPPWALTKQARKTASNPISPSPGPQAPAP
jgi:hypothetical protein